MQTLKGEKGNFASYMRDSSIRPSETTLKDQQSDVISCQKKEALIVVVVSRMIAKAEREIQH